MKLMMKFSAMFGLLMMLTSCQDQLMNVDDLVTDNSNDSPVLAKVGDELIFTSDLESELKRLPTSMRHLADSADVRRQVEELLVRRAVLSQQAVTQGLDVKPEIYAQLRRVRDDILIEAVKNQFLSNQPIPEEEKMREYYQQHQEEFTIPEQIHAAHILLHDEDEAKNVLKALKKKPEQFATLAARYSLDDSNKARGGDLNWFPRGIMDQAFEKAAFSIKEEGDFSQPIETESGWHIIVLKGRKAASVQTFDESRREIVHILQHHAFEDWVKRLILHADIRRPQHADKNDVIKLPEGIAPQIKDGR